METNKIPAGAVVVGVDGSTHADHALDWAARCARVQGRDLVVVHSIGDTTTAQEMMGAGDVGPAAFLEHAGQRGQAILDSALARLERDQFPGSASAILASSDPREVLIAAAERASIVVVGSRGRGPILSLLMGSVSVAVARHASCPVVVVRPHHEGTVRRGVLVGADASEESLPILEFAYRQAADLDLPLTVLHTVWGGPLGSGVAGELQPVAPPLPEGDLELAESLAGLAEKFPEVHVDRVVEPGAPAGTLIRLAGTMNLVVVGRHSKGVMGRAVLGSVAIPVLEHAATTVAIVPER